jgi:hypothetical protein
MTPLTWMVTILCVFLGAWLTLRANTFTEGMAHAIIAGTVLGLLNLGAHDAWWRYRKRGQ